MKAFSILFKPAGDRCNLSCRYCFYLGHGGGAASRDVVDALLASYMALPFAEKSVALQGGEPLLSPEYVFDMMEAQPLLDKSVQTNATLITDAFAERFAKNGWLVGASLDGPRESNAKRTAKDGTESFDNAVRGIRRLEKAGAEYNILSVVSHANAAKPAETYRFLRDGFSTRFHQYIECTGPSSAEALSAGEWSGFLCGLFDEWIKADAHEISIGLFDSIVSQLVRGFPTRCASAGHCRHYFVVDWDGSIYPCDFHVRPDLRLGNVLTDSWEKIAESPLYRRFAEAKVAGLPAKCLKCRYFAFCAGDCPRSRNSDGASSLCEGWKKFFDHAMPAFERLAAGIIQ